MGRFMTAVLAAVGLIAIAILRRTFLPQWTTTLDEGKKLPNVVSGIHKVMPRIMNILFNRALIPSAKEPSPFPTESPTVETSSVAPTPDPSAEPSPFPTESPTVETSSVAPTPDPTVCPTRATPSLPTFLPSEFPTAIPSSPPTSSAPTDDDECGLAVCPGCSGIKGHTTEGRHSLRTLGEKGKKKKKNADPTKEGIPKVAEKIPGNGGIVFERKEGGGKTLQWFVDHLGEEAKCIRCKCTFDEEHAADFYNAKICPLPDETKEKVQELAKRPVTEDFSMENKLTEIMKIIHESFKSLNKGDDKKHKYYFCGKTKADAIEKSKPKSDCTKEGAIKECRYRDRKEKWWGQETCLKAECDDKTYLFCAKSDSDAKTYCQTSRNFCPSAKNEECKKGFKCFELSKNECIASMGYVCRNYAQCVFELTKDDKGNSLFNPKLDVKAECGPDHAWVSITDKSNKRTYHMDAIQKNLIYNKLKEKE